MNNELLIAFLGFLGTVLTTAFAVWKIVQKQRREEINQLNGRVESAHVREIERLEKQAGVLERVKEFMDKLQETQALDRTTDAQFRSFVTQALSDIKHELARTRPKA